MLQGDIEHRCGEGDPGIQLFLKDQGNAFAEHIAQYAAEHPRDHRSNGGDNRPFTHIERDLRADDRKDDQPQRIQHQEKAAQVGHNGGNDGSKYGSRRHDNHVLGVFNPAERVMAKQDIAYGTAAQRGRGSNNDDAEGVHTATSGSKCAGHGFCGDANKIKNVKQHRPSGVNAWRLAICAQDHD